MCGCLARYLCLGRCNNPFQHIYSLSTMYFGASTWRRREWVSAELATLYSYTDVSLWMWNISWDHFLTTVQLTDFGHRHICIWYIFPVLYCMQDINSMTRHWSGTFCMESPEAYHWASNTTGNPGKPWCLHLGSSVVSSNPVLAPASPGGPSWSTPATSSKLRPHPINITQVTLSFDMYLLFAYLSGWHALFWRHLEHKESPFSNLKTGTPVILMAILRIQVQ